MKFFKSRLVLAFKEPNTPKENKKAKLVAQAIGKLDEDKKIFMTYYSTVTRAIVRKIHCILTKKGLKVYLRDMS